MSWCGSAVKGDFSGNMQKKVVIIAEHLNGAVRPVTFELIACGKEILRLAPGSMRVIVMGADIGALARQLAEKTGQDVDGIFVPGLDTYHGETCRNALHQWFSENPFDYLCAAHSSSGLDFVPGLAIRLNAANITGVEAVSDIDGHLCFSRHVNGGKIVTTLAPQHTPVLLTVQPGVFGSAGVASRPAGNVDLRTVTATSNRSFSRGLKLDRAADTSLTDADVIVAAGNGLPDRDQLDLIRQMADLFPKSAVAGSRIVCDRGWMDYRQQVGVTGATVSPALYIACGISGASQHISGMRTSGFIVSINTDPNAAIGNIADICVVEDLTTFVPAFIEAYHSMKQEENDHE